MAARIDDAQGVVDVRTRDTGSVDGGDGRVPGGGIARRGTVDGIGIGDGAFDRYAG